MMSRLRTYFLALLAVSMLAIPTGAAATSMTAAVPAFCTGTGPILATDISAPVDLSTCPIQGRQIVQSLGNGLTGAGVYVPPAGSEEGNAALATTGGYELIVSNAAGFVTVQESASSGQAGATVTTNTDPACSQSAFNYEPDKWTATDKWFYNKSTASRAGLTVSATTSDIRAANTNMTTGVNDCGFTGQPAAFGAFQGDTSLFANINSAGNCTSRFPDGQSTVSWGPFDSGLNFLAVTCFFGTGGTMEEGDIYFGSNVGMVDHLPSGCVSKSDLQSVATHEWGHVFGMAHETSGNRETMYPVGGPCIAGQRTLGLGDWQGMVNRYGLR